MTDLYLTHIASIVAICILLSLANIILAVRSISAGAALAFALGFSATGVTWSIAAYLPQTGDQAGFGLLLLNVAGALGLIALWCGFWLRAGYDISRWFMLGLFALWNAPVVAILAFDLAPDTHVPFAVASIALGIGTSLWLMYRKKGTKNAGDWALTGWLAFVLMVSLSALVLGLVGRGGDPNAVWMFYLTFLPTLFTGAGVFTLLGFTLDALRDTAELARTDGLTGLLNRRAFDNELGIAIARAERYKRDLSLVVLDIDHFKRLNDAHGHPAGDGVLRSVAEVLVGGSRRVDSVARLGGEEFALILPDTPASASLRLAERLRQAVYEASEESIVFTASFGVASVTDTGHSEELLLKAADKALYAAKEAGRNCVRYSGEPERDPGGLIGVAN